MRNRLMLFAPLLTSVMAGCGGEAALDHAAAPVGILPDSFTRTRVRPDTRMCVSPCLRDPGLGLRRDGWRIEGSGSVDWLLDVSGAKGAGVWAIGARGTLIHSGGDGNWRQVATPKTEDQFHSLSVAGPGEVYVGGAHARTDSVATDAVLLHTRDGGATWSRRTVPGDKVVALAARAGGVVVAGTSEGVLRSTDYGASWRLADAGLVAVQRIRRVGDALFAVGGEQMLDIRRSIDDGARWKRVYAAYSTNFATVRSVWGTGSRVYAGAALSKQNAMLTSSDGGASWILLPPSANPVQGAGLRDLWGVSPGEVLVAADAVYRSQDGAATWAPDAGTDWGPTVYALWGDDDGNLYAVGNDGLILRRPRAK